MNPKEVFLNTAFSVQLPYTAGHSLNKNKIPKQKRLNFQTLSLQLSSWHLPKAKNLYIYFASQGVCTSVCLFLSNKRLNWSSGPSFLWDLAWPHEILRMIEFASNKIQFLKILKIHEIFSGNPQTFCFVLLYNVHKENMFTINLED